MTEPKRAEDPKSEKRLEREIELSASVEEVWKALTDGKELVRWFPLEARVTPGVGGKIFLSWGPGFEGETEIVAWEPGKKLATKGQFASVEWTLESKKGKTILRLVQSGFMGQSDWENEWFESTSFGWGFMLLSLQVALERHPGIARQVAWARVKVSVAREDAYRKLLEPGALFKEKIRNALEAGKPFAFTTTAGDSFSGRVELVQENRGFCLTVRELNDALLWLTIEGTPGSIEAQAWLSAFGIEPARVKEFESVWEKRLRAAIPEAIP